MHFSQWVPFYGPGRHGDLPVVQFLVRFDDGEIEQAASGHRQLAKRLDEVLQDGEVIEAGESLSLGTPGEDPGAWLAASYCRMALLLQQKCGHEVEFFKVQATGTPGEYLCAFEHEHADVGMTACKLAWHLCAGKRRLAGPPFRTLARFAADKVMHPEARYLVREAIKRGIPCRRLDYEPFGRNSFRDWIFGERAKPNGLVLLGHSRHKVLFDGLQCLWPEDRRTTVPETLTGAPPKAWASQVLESLFPDGIRADLPITAITGTNGKTTTTRMVAHILGNSGLEPGMTCTDGMYVKGHNVLPGERGGLLGHTTLLEREDIDVAVLETTLGTLHQNGLAFTSCDVAICLNISHDHDGEWEIETLEEIAEIKRSLVERASVAAILFADDPRCLEMMPYVQASRTCLVSTSASEQEIDQRGSGKTDACYLDDRGNVMLRSGSERISLGPILDMPAGRFGRASHNTINAVHAMAAAFYMGTAPDRVGAAMQKFEFTFDNTPGRWNVHDNGRFRVIMDCVHNIAGFRSICSCVDQEEVTGRKLLMFSFPGNRRIDMVQSASAEVAGHFDLYYVRPFVNLADSDRDEYLKLIEKSLMDNGVRKDDIALLEDADAAVDRVLAAARPGDLVLMKVHKNEFDSLWRRITTHQPL